MSEEGQFNHHGVESPLPVTVVIPCYNMAWCLERAVRSCFEQSLGRPRIIIVDDGSTDQTATLAKAMERDHEELLYLKQSKNQGHLSALTAGMQAATTQWVALLDADDQLTPDSLEYRLHAAQEFLQSHGELPGLIYGNLDRVTSAKKVRREYFKPIKGHDLPYLLKELSLCQTSTIMLSKQATAKVFGIKNVYNTDDEIVLAVAKEFPLLHCGETVTVAHDHESPSRMTGNAFRRLRGITQLVRHHQFNILRTHGLKRLFLWYLRVFRVGLEWQMQIYSQSILSGYATEPSKTKEAYRNLLISWHRKLSKYLKEQFENLYF